MVRETDVKKHSRKSRKTGLDYSVRKHKRTLGFPEDVARSDTPWWKKEKEFSIQKPGGLSNDVVIQKRIHYLDDKARTYDDVEHPQFPTGETKSNAQEIAGQLIENSNESWRLSREWDRTPKEDRYKLDNRFRDVKRNREEKEKELDDLLLGKNVK